MKKYILFGLIVIIVFITGCSDSSVVDNNVTKDAENFKVYRRIVFINNITGEYLLEMRGFCNIESDTVDKQLEVICKDNNGKYAKNFLGVNETTTYFVEQLDTKSISDKHYKLVVKPSALIPTIEVR